MMSNLLLLPLIVMANSLVLSVIAERVETQAQQQLLLTKGCKHYQGYLCSKPVLIEQFEALLQQRYQHI
jgi:EAL domain-containing protein (putative c-di-GMP-specific phosphodiesterase class I)